MKKDIYTIDSHTEGEPTRVIVGGIVNVPGKDIQEKRVYIQKHYDYVRKALICEPRGHRDMFGCFLVEPTSSEADFGIIFIDNYHYLNMCGHGTIGIATTVVESGLVDIRNKEDKTIAFESPAGLIKVKVDFDEKTGKVKSAALTNAPAFAEYIDLEVDVDGYGKIKVDVVFGGNYFAILPVEQFGVTIEPQNTTKLKELGALVKAATNKAVEIVHPEKSYIKGVDIVTFFTEDTEPDIKYRNVHIFSTKQADRSPGGTGTSAMLARYYARGILKVGDEIFSQGLLGSGTFKGKILESVKIGKFEGIIPQVTGKAYVTGHHHFIIDDEDEVGMGFVLE